MGGDLCCVALTICVASATPACDCRKPRIDYSRFSHLTEQHRAACSSCHTFPSKNWKQVRKGDDAFADVTEYPEHQACLSCHRQQFFATRATRAADLLELSCESDSDRDVSISVSESR